jgi:hypothetical protein
MSKIYLLGETMPISHEHMVDKTESLCAKIDSVGGWNPKAETVKFCHTDRREMAFSDDYGNCGWWTVVLTRDKYYWWKLSEPFKNKVVKKVLESTADSIRYKNPKGFVPNHFDIKLTKL